MANVQLRKIIESDLDTFFEQQLDHAANQMAAFTAKDPTDYDGFQLKWEKILADVAIVVRTIIYKGQIAGNILSHGWFGDPEVSYWIGKKFWGLGIATEALAIFLKVEGKRPLFARAAKDNIASIRVLEKCGFVKFGEDSGFANARGQEIDEILLRLD